MRVRFAFTTGLVAAVLCASVTIAQPQYPRGDPSCPPFQLCLRYNPLDRLGRSVDPADYQYRLHDPYLATTTAGALNPDGLTPGVKREVVRVPGLPGRDRLPMLEGRGEVNVALYRQYGPAPLVFILGGMGSNPFFGLGTYYASLFHKHGAHVVVLPSPMTWNFALGASRSGTPGYTPDDTRDLYRLMQATLTHLRSRHGVQVTNVDFMGASLGALEGAHLSVLDADEGKIGIRHYLLLNPPPDLSYALEKLNEWQALGAMLGKERATTVALRARGLIEDYIEERRSNPDASFDRATREFSRFSTEELQYAIAQYLHLVLPELVYVTQGIDDQGVLTAPRDQGRKRLQEARAFTLKDYQEKIAVPRRQRQELGANGDGLNQRGSLWPILDRLRENPRVHIMHNADDILAERTAIEELKKIMGGQMTLYPYGGHLGNLWYAPNQEDILRFFGVAAGTVQPSSPRSAASSRLSRSGR
jgi:hypothetical protein